MLDVDAFVAGLWLVPFSAGLASRLTPTLPPVFSLSASPGLFGTVRLLSVA